MDDAGASLMTGLAVIYNLTLTILLHYKSRHVDLLG